MASHNSSRSNLLNSNLLSISSRSVSEVSLKGKVMKWLHTFFAGNYRFNVAKTSEMKAIDLRYMLASTHDAVEKAPEGTHHVDDVKAILKSFDADMRAPFNMYMAGYTYSEIAEALSLNEGEVRSRIIFASKRLNEQLVGLAS